MSLKKVSAIFNGMEKSKLEAAFLRAGVCGYTIHDVRGHGVYNQAYGQKELVEHLQVDIFTSAECAHAIANLIVETVSVNADSEGLVAILPVDALYWIHTKEKASATEFNFYPPTN
jgi:nitrogen regulatory protein P-II 1